MSACVWCDVCVCVRKNKQSADRRCLENRRGGQQCLDSNHIQQPEMSQANEELQIPIWETVEQMNRQTDRHCITVVTFSSPVWCTAACHWSAVCACPLKESSSSWLLPLSLYLEAIKVLLSEKWTDKERSVSGWEKNGRALQRKSVISSHAQQGPERHWVLRWHFSSGWGGAVPSIFHVDVVTLTLLSVSYK